MTYLGGYSAQAPYSLSVISFSHRYAAKHNGQRNQIWCTQEDSNFRPLGS